MEKIEFVGLDSTLYKEELKNGLTIYMIPFEDKKNYSISYATKYGSDILEFTKGGSKEKVKVPAGIAHFLEHKMFEQEDGEDPFAFYSRSGSDANAATDHDYTKYICGGTKNFAENLRYLLKYVSSPYFTDQNVEKEKGIIAEEINMYLDIPEYYIEYHFFENVLKYHPRRIDVGGKVEDIYKITKENLYDCYNTFYQPNNMFVLITGKFEVEEALNIIKEELEEKENTTSKRPIINKYNEPLEVNVAEETITAAIKVPKVCFAIKLDKNSFGIKNDFTLNLYLNMIGAVLFGSSSSFREKARSNNLMTSLFSGFETIEDVVIYNFMAESKKPEELIKEVEATLSNIYISDEDFNRYKKVWVANEVRLFDYVDAATNTIFSDIILYDKVITNRVEAVRKMTKKELDKVISKINLDNKTTLIALPKED